MHPEIAGILDFHRDMAARHPRLYRALFGFWWLITDERASRLFIRTIGAASVVLGIFAVIVALTES